MYSYGKLFMNEIYRRKDLSILTALKGFNVHSIKERRERIKASPTHGNLLTIIVMRAITDYYSFMLILDYTTIYRLKRVGFIRFKKYTSTLFYMSLLTI